MIKLEPQKNKSEDYPLIPKDPEIDPYEETEEDDEWGFLSRVEEVFQANKIQIATDEQNEKARKYFERRDKLVEGCPRSSLHVYDPMLYMDNYNRLVRDNHVLPSQVESLMISLNPIRNTTGGKKMFEVLEKKMHSAKLSLGKTMRKL